MIERFSEHYRIDQYLRNKNTQSIKSKTFIISENILSNFPIGLIILGKEAFKFEDKIEFINQYACKLFKLKENVNIKELKEKFNEFIKLKNNSKKTNLTLNELIFNNSSFNLDLDNFTPFESTYSKSVILYIKINDVDNVKYIVIDKYDKYVDERKYIELNLIKTINYQYLHTLYHELNNPLNALLAISGESDKTQIFSSDISNSRIDKKSTYIPMKAIKTNKRINNNTTLNSKKERNFGLLSVSLNKLRFSQDFTEAKSRKKIIMEENEINNQIPLLVNIIKIFIKNFILYLKTRADNLLMIKNEFDIQNEASDIMNAIEVSEYEKELTKHKSVKINLEYIFNLYFEKFLCLFKYKEIDFETNFDKLKNIYVITDEFNFIYYIRQIYTYLYYIIPKKEGFMFNYKEDKENNTVQIIIKKKTDVNKPNKPSLDLNGYFYKDKKNDITQVIQTKEMTKEVLYSMSKKLNFGLEIFDLENSDNNNKDDNIYLKITMPIQRKDKSDEEDDFKDEDINEMIQKDNYLLEDKLKRVFPNCVPVKKRKSNNSISIMSSKNGKENSESSIEFQKNETKAITNSNSNLKSSKRNTENNIKINEIQKRQNLMNDNSDNFLNKCLKITENKNKDFDKNHKNNKNLLKLKKFNPKMKNHSSDKNTVYEDIQSKNELEIKSQKLSGVFTKITNLGLAEELDCKDMCISIADNINKNKKREVPKNKSQSIYISNNTFNIEKNIYTQNSTNLKSTIQGLKNSNIKNSYFISDVLDNRNKNINININNNNIINIIHDNSSKKNNSFLGLNNQDEKPLPLSMVNEQKIKGNEIFHSQNKEKVDNLPEFEKANPKRFSQNVSPKIRPKDCMTFFQGDKKGTLTKEKKTLLNDSINQNEKLVVGSNKERELYLQKSSQKEDGSDNCISNSQLDEESEEIEDNVIISQEKEPEEEKINCNCADILVVDDEEFNVMASQKMLKKLGFDSNAAYNGEECINLIKEKEKLNCKCNKNYYQIIFLDIVMPILNGIKTAKKIQEMIDNKEINENIQIVFISGNINENELKESLLKINCVKECLPKPVRVDKYQKILDKYYKNNSNN